jgi:hypothetical protein
MARMRARNIKAAHLHFGAAVGFPDQPFSTIFRLSRIVLAIRVLSLAETQSLELILHVRNTIGAGKAGSFVDGTFAIVLLYPYVL